MLIYGKVSGYFQKSLDYISFGFVEMCITPHSTYLNILLGISINLAYAQYGDNRI